ncbi:MAG: hypothetical protein ACE5HT_00310 [Gemmatimonadales bacterium]
MRVRVCAGLLVLLLSACTGRRQLRPVVPWCVEPTGQLASDAAADSIAGSYVLTMVATKGARAGERVGGRLTLLPTEGEWRQLIGAGGSPDPNTVIQAYGTTDIALEEVGAIRVGDIASSDVSKPGVAVLQTKAGAGAGGRPTITLRLGSAANERGVLRFDGGFTVLYVRKMDRAGFAGGWASGVRDKQAEGFFCAYRNGG